MDAKETKNYFEKLLNIDVSDYLKEKQGLSYLPWAIAWQELKLRDPLAEFKILEDINNNIYFSDGKTCWVKVSVTAFGKTHTEILPVMNNRNQAIPLENVTSADVNKAIKRCLTKCIALHGLGLMAYLGEEFINDIKEEKSRIKDEMLNKKRKEFNALAHEKIQENPENRNRIYALVSKVNDGNPNPNSIKDINILDKLITKLKELKKGELLEYDSI